MTYDGLSDVVQPTSRRVDLNSVLEGCVFVFVGVWKRELNLLASAV